MKDEHVRSVGMLGRERVETGPPDRHKQGELVGHEAVDVPQLLFVAFADKPPDSGKLILHGLIMT